MGERTQDFKTRFNPGGETLNAYDVVSYFIDEPVEGRDPVLEAGVEVIKYRRQQ